MKHNALTDRKIANLNQTGRYSDGHGLWLQVSKWGTKSWILRYVGFDGRQRQMGLGSVHDVSLAVARQRAKKAREALSDPDSPVDPVEARRQKREQARIEAAKRITFKACCEKYIAANEGEWKNDKHKYQWRQTLLGDYCKPLHDLPVSAIDTALVLKVLDPIWDVKRETAVRLRVRIERVLAWATAREYRKGDNPARWQGHLREALNHNGRTIEHHAALPFADLPAFMLELHGKDTVSAKALEFTILTAARTGETIGATWGDIDLTAKLWTVPGERMKKGKTHIVPLSERAVEILSKLPRETRNDHVFVGGKGGSGLSNEAMLALLKDMRPGLTVHGFRSAFSDWAGDRTNFDRQTREFALAHGLTDKTEASYRHTTAVDKRRRLMRDWSRYCASTPAKAENVTPIRARARWHADARRAQLGLTLPRG